MARLSSCSRPGGRCYGVVALLLAVFCLARTGEAFLFAARPGASTSSSSSSMAQRITGLTRRASSVQERQQTTITTASPASARTSSSGNPHQQQQQQQQHQVDTEECRVVLEGEEKDSGLLPESLFQTLPWSRSITGEAKDALLYMPFVEEQLRHLQQLEGEAVRSLPVPPTVAYQRSERKAAHMASFCVETADFRKVRFTYMDGGSCVQVFNSVWYPRFDTDAPILGVDLLLFGGHKMLAVVDYQPLAKTPEYAARFLDHLAPIKAKYPALGETISNRYYEDTRWFSDHMLFGRLQDPAQIAGALMPAFQEYLGAYTGLVRASRQEGGGGMKGVMDEAAVKARHRDYDEYNLIRDPAGKLFEAYFGKPFAAEMLGFLFELADPAVLAAHEAEQERMYGPGGSGPIQQPQQPAGAAAAAQQQQ